MVILALFALVLTGCPALIVGSLAYGGYEYEKTWDLAREATVANALTLE